VPPGPGETDQRAREVERPYPISTSGFFFPARSDQAPEKSFRRLAVVSATPSIRPRAAGPDASVVARNTGSSG